MKPTAPESHDLSGVRRLAHWSSAVAIVIAYAVLIPMKWRGLLSPDMTWVRIIVGPVLIIGFVPILVGYEARPMKKCDTVFLVATLALISGAILFVLS